MHVKVASYQAFRVSKWTFFKTLKGGLAFECKYWKTSMTSLGFISKTFLPASHVLPRSLQVTLLFLNLCPKWPRSWVCTYTNFTAQSTVNNEFREIILVYRIVWFHWVSLQNLAFENQLTLLNCKCNAVSNEGVCISCHRLQDRCGKSMASFKIS